MRALEFAVFFVMVDNVRDSLLVIEALLINCVLGQVWLDDVEFAEMAPTGAVLADTSFLVVVREVALGQF